MTAMSSRSRPLASPPPAGRETDLEDFLAAASGSWSAMGGISLLTPRVLAQINESFKTLPTPKKISCLLSFANAQGAHLARSAEMMQSIIDMAGSDPDNWVQGLARLLDGYPCARLLGKAPWECATIDCAKVDNEFLYRLEEVINLRSPTGSNAVGNRQDGGTPSPKGPSATLPLPTLPLTRDAVFISPAAAQDAGGVSPLTDPTSPSPLKQRQQAPTFDSSSVHKLFEEIEGKARETLEKLGIEGGVSGGSADMVFNWDLDDAPFHHAMSRSMPSRASGVFSGAASNFPSGGRRERGERLAERTERKLDWDSAGLEEAERAAVAPLGSRHSRPSRPGERRMNLETDMSTPKQARIAKPASPVIQAVAPNSPLIAPVIAPSTEPCSPGGGFWPTSPSEEKQTELPDETALPVARGVPVARAPAPQTLGKAAQPEGGRGQRSDRSRSRDRRAR